MKNKITYAGHNTLPHSSNHPPNFQQWLQDYTRQITPSNDVSESKASMPLSGAIEAVDKVDGIVSMDESY